jgi:hypothetical protein
MEVHHHRSTGSQKWTHYLWEFIMLFLAVYLGFLVENLREYRIENKRADSYIGSFYDDLKTDTSKLNSLIRSETDKVNKLGIFKACYDSLLQNHNPSSLLAIIKNTQFKNGFNPEKRTLDQLFNAGGFRLLKKEDADSITGYVGGCSILESFKNTVYQHTQDNLRDIFNQIVSFPANASLNRYLAEQPIIDVDSTALQVFRTDDKHLLEQYFNTLLQYIRVIVLHRNLMKWVNQKAAGLIDYFKKKYRFN